MGWKQYKERNGAGTALPPAKRLTCGIKNRDREGEGCVGKALVPTLYTAGQLLRYSCSRSMHTEPRIIHQKVRHMPCRSHEQKSPILKMCYTDESRSLELFLKRRRRQPVRESGIGHFKKKLLIRASTLGSPLQTITACKIAQIFFECLQVHTIRYGRSHHKPYRSHSKDQLLEKTKLSWHTAVKFS